MQNKKRYLQNSSQFQFVMKNIQKKLSTTVEVSKADTYGFKNFVRFREENLK